MHSLTFNIRQAQLEFKVMHWMQQQEEYKCIENHVTIIWPSPDIMWILFLQITYVTFDRVILMIALWVGQQLQTFPSLCIQRVLMSYSEQDVLGADNTVWLKQARAHLTNQ